MKFLKDAIHDCQKCSIYPCTFQEIVESDVCKECPTPCCRGVVLPILPCEESLKIELRKDEWCNYFDVENYVCKIYDIRPVTCRIASCRFIEEGKIPEKLKRSNITD